MLWLLWREKQLWSAEWVYTWILADAKANSPTYSDC